MCFPINAQAAPNFQAEWDSQINAIQLTWEPLPKPEEGEEYYLYHNYNDGLGWAGWTKDSSGKINNETSRTISNYLSNSEYQYQIRLLKDDQKTIYATSNKIQTKKSNFTATAKWTGEDIIIEWTNASRGVVSDFVNGINVKIYFAVDSGESQFLLQGDGRESAKIKVSEYGFYPQKGEHWDIVIDNGDYPISRSIFCGEPGSEGATDLENPEESSGNSGNKGISQNIPIFQANSWVIVMFWYKILASLSGLFVFFTLIRCGYQYMHTDNSGIRASVIDTLQKCVIALIFIMLVPTFIDLLIQINDAIVELCLNTFNALTQKEVALKDLGLDVTLANAATKTDWMASLCAAPFTLIMEGIEKLFGLHNLGNIIFNTAPESTVLSNGVLYGGGVNTGNPFTQALTGLAFMVFTIYYNAVYLLRRWVIIAVTAVAPIIIWIWALSENKTVIQIWLAEVFQTIFMQTFHALTFGIIFSVLCFNGSIPTLIPTDDIVTSLINIGKFVAWFAGVICAGSIIFNSFRLIIAESDQVRADIRTNIGRSIIGLIIIGLSLLVAGVLTETNIVIPIPNEAANIGKITMLQFFMAMVAIIPISKMLSMIFMNLISRIGTVDEDRWAARRLGMIGGLFGLGAATKSAASSIGVPTPKDSAGDSKPIPPSNISAEDNFNYHSDPYGIKDALKTAPGTVSSAGHQGSMLRPQDVGQSSGSWVYNHDTGKVQDYNSFNKGKEDHLEPPPMTLPQGIPVPPSVDPGWSDTIYNKDENKFYDAKTGEEVGGILSPDLKDWIDGGCIDPVEQKNYEKSQQKENFTDAMKTAAQNPAVNKTARGAGKISESIAPGTSGFFEGIGKSAAVVTATASAFNKGTDLVSMTGIRPKINAGNIQNFTGRDTSLGGLAQMGTATILSPLGPNIATGISTKLGGGIDVIAPTVGNFSQQVAAKAKNNIDWIRGID